MLKFNYGSIHITLHDRHTWPHVHTCSIQNFVLLPLIHDQIYGIPKVKINIEDKI